jgi:hypothetical protein
MAYRECRGAKQLQQVRPAPLAATLHIVLTRLFSIRRELGKPCWGWQKREAEDAQKLIPFILAPK